MKILLITDNFSTQFDLLNYIDHLLSETERKKSLIVITSRFESIQVVKDHCFDVVFFDLCFSPAEGLILAEQLRKIYPLLNIICIADCDSYSAHAFTIHCSGYLKKPLSQQSIDEEFENLRYPVSKIKTHEDYFKIHCFGNFNVLYKEKPLHFKRKRTKELFAYLIYRNGEIATVKEICSTIFSDLSTSVNHGNTLRILSMELKHLLTSVGKEDVYFHRRNAYAIIPGLLCCDYYEYLAGNIDLYNGKFMEQYKNWAVFEH